jgi:hypothetical protein
MASMQLPQWLARFNRHFTNPIQRMWAGWAPTFGIFEHVGRKSGKPYRTPLTVFSTDDGVAIMLTYGPNREAAPAVKGLWRPIFARLPFEQAVLLTRI